MRNDLLHEYPFESYDDMMLALGKGEISFVFDERHAPEFAYSFNKKCRRWSAITYLLPLFTLLIFCFIYSNYWYLLFYIIIFVGLTAIVNIPWISIICVVTFIASYFFNYSSIIPAICLSLFVGKQAYTFWWCVTQAELTALIQNEPGAFALLWERKLVALRDNQGHLYCY